MIEWILLDDARTEGFQAGVEQGIEQERKERERERMNGIREFILDKLEDGADRETIMMKMKKIFSLSEEEAEKYWEEIKR